jgi:hypothetical protein
MQSDTFLVAVISANREMHENLAAALEDDRQVESFWTLADYPAPQQIAELLECRSGCVVFLDFADGSRAEQVARQLGEHAGKATVIGIQPAGSDAGRLIEMMRLGIEDALTAPLLARDA